MKIKSNLFAAIPFILMFFIQITPSSSWAAACDPEIGEWRQFKKSPSDFERSEVSRYAFKSGKVFSGSRGIVRARQGSASIDGSYAVRSLWTGNRLQLKFIRNGKLLGTFDLELPGTWAFFQTQIPEVRDVSKDERRMYKELRIEGRFNSGGIFTADLSNQPSYRLIFQGVGTRCFDPGDYTRWVLQIMGPDPEAPNSSKRIVYYWFRGSFITPS